MAITLEKESIEKKEFKIPLPVLIVIIAVLVFGIICYFLFFGKPGKVELPEAKEGLTKEDIKNIATLLSAADDPTLRTILERFVVIISRTVVAEPGVDTTKLGKSNPFVP